MLQEFVIFNRAAIIAACRVKTLQRSHAPATEAEIDHGVPMFLEQLVEQLRAELPGSPDINATASQHGRDLLRQGYSVSQVVHGYGDVCQTITEIAIEQDAPIPTDDFRTLNRCLDDAIAGAVTEFAEARDRYVDIEAAAESDRVGVLAHELHRIIRCSGAALDVVTSGKVGLSGNTGKLLNASIETAEGLIERLVDEVNARRPKHAATSYDSDATKV